MAETHLEDCITDAKGSLVENLEGHENYLRRHGADSAARDAIHEAANGAVPVYIYDLLDVFRSESNLWYETPDSGFDGCESVMGAISLMIYEAITAALYSYANELEGDDIVCEEDGCDKEDDHDTPAEVNPRCTEHCGGVGACDTCQEAYDADYCAALAEASEEGDR